MTLSQGNADEERVFFLVGKNRTDFRASLDLNRTLSSVITVKMNLDESSHQFKPSKNLLKKAKAATWNCIQLHDGKSKKDNNTQQNTSFSSSASSVPTNPSGPTKSYSKNVAALKATCGNITSTAASTRGLVNSSNRTSDETIPIPKPFGAPAFAFTGHTFVRQDKKKPSVGKQKIDAAIPVDQTDDTKKKKGGDPLVSNPANGVKGTTKNDGRKGSQGLLYILHYLDHFPRRMKTEKTAMIKTMLHRFRRRTTKEKQAKIRILSIKRLFSASKNLLRHLKLFMFQNRHRTASKILKHWRKGCWEEIYSDPSFHSKTTRDIRFLYSSQ